MKRSSVRARFAIAFLTACLALPAVAQRPERTRNPRGDNSRFAASAPEVGSAFPELDIHDENGQPLNTRSLKGKYTVVVNGCLT
jgi:hypothetical protein